ncbi:MAG TPA: MFS transporter, partial [Pseudolysinimonas sp.]|nr:MFS transporter [Pseudolysinimonas sp.]
MFPRPVSFLVAAAAGAATLTAASAPSPLYPVYERLWHFSPFVLTVIFAAYVIALLLALLTVGSLSDTVGRRPVTAAAMVLLAIGMVIFSLSDGVGGLLAARVVQGIAVGAASGTITAMIVDSGPGPKRASVVSSAVSPLGIVIGAVLAGALVEFAPLPRQLVFWVLAALDILIAVLVCFIPEQTRPSDRSWAAVGRSLRPSAGLPTSARPVFFASVPALVATWA